MEKRRFFRNVYIIFYKGGRGGEFWTSFLNAHNQIKNQNFDYDFTNNKYRTHDPCPELVSGQFIGLSEIERQKVLSDLKIPKQDILVLRTHNFSEAESYLELIPGSKLIMLNTNKYLGFFNDLYTIKFETTFFDYANDIRVREHLAAGRIMPQHYCQDLDTCDCMTNVKIQPWQIIQADLSGRAGTAEEYAGCRPFDHMSSTLNPNQDLIVKAADNYNKAYDNYRLIDLDKIYFEKDIKGYFELCKWMDIRPLPDARFILETYHARNVQLVKSFGLDVGQDPSDPEEFKKKAIEHFMTIYNSNRHVDNQNPAQDMSPTLRAKIIHAKLTK